VSVERVASVGEELIGDLAQLLFPLVNRGDQERRRS
jgi:hypothetical protein